MQGCAFFSPLTNHEALDMQEMKVKVVSLSKGEQRMESDFQNSQIILFYMFQF